MKNIFKNKIVTIVILIATLVLAGIAVFTATRLYQLRQEAIAPNVPSSQPAAATAPPAACTQLTFTLSSPTATATATATSTATATATATSTATATATATATTTATPLSCNNSCSTDAGCQAGLVCSAGKCRNTSCTTETDCDCSVATAAPTNPPGTQTTLPPTGFSLPTILGGGLGILVILGAVLLLI